MEPTDYWGKRYEKELMPLREGSPEWWAAFRTFVADIQTDALPTKPTLDAYEQGRKDERAKWMRRLQLMLGEERG